MAVSADDLFLAILALDAYNRGTDVGISIEGNSIGSATVKKNSNELPGVDGSGFYAQEYKLADGRTVISYRGTTFTGLPDGADVLHGWTLSAGYSGADQLA
jgi:hypothetical protein